MKRGTVKFLNYNNFEHLFVKLNDDNLGIWRFENLGIVPDERITIQITDEDVLKDKTFSILDAYGICVELATNRICIITNRTSNSTEVFMRKSDKVSVRTLEDGTKENFYAGVNCRNWFTDKDFLKNYLPIPY